jgi:hypothetical protein
MYTSVEPPCANDCVTKAMIAQRQRIKISPISESTLACFRYRQCYPLGLRIWRIGVQDIWARRWPCQRLRRLLARHAAPHPFSSTCSIKIPTWPPSPFTRCDVMSSNCHAIVHSRFMQPLHHETVRRNHAAICGEHNGTRCVDVTGNFPGGSGKSLVPL